MIQKLNCKIFEVDKIYAFDPALKRSGYAVFDLDKDKKIWKVSNYGILGNENFCSRGEALVSIYANLHRFFDIPYSHKHHCVYEEHMAFGASASNKALGAVEGIFLLKFHSFEFPYFGYTESQVRKFILGKGKGREKDKEGIKTVVCQILDIPNDCINFYDETDAMAIGVYHICQGIFLPFYKKIYEKFRRKMRISLPTLIDKIENKFYTGVTGYWRRFVSLNYNHFNNKINFVQNLLDLDFKSLKFFLNE